MHGNNNEFLAGSKPWPLMSYKKTSTHEVTKWISLSKYCIVQRSVNNPEHIIILQGFRQSQRNRKTVPI